MLYIYTQEAQFIPIPGKLKIIPGQNPTCDLDSQQHDKLRVLSVS